MSARRATWAGAALLAAVGCGGEVQTAPAQRVPAASLVDEAPATIANKADWYVQHHWVQRTPCGDGCVYATHHHSEVRLVLGSNGQASSVDHGEVLEETESAVGGNARITRWRRELEGEWTERDGRLSIKLKPKALTCERVGRDGSKSDPCEPLALRLVCEKAQLQISEPTKKLADGWVCVPRRRTHADEMTPLPWVFGTNDWLVAIERGDPRIRRGPRRKYAVGDVATYPRRRRGKR